MPSLSSTTVISTSPILVPGVIVIILSTIFTVAFSVSALDTEIFPVYALFVTVITTFSPSICVTPVFALNLKNDSPQTAFKVVSAFKFNLVYNVTTRYA